MRLSGGLLVFNALLGDREVSYELHDPNPQQAADAVYAALETARAVAFENSPVDYGKIKALAGNERAMTPQQLAAAISTVSAARLEEQLAAMAEKSRMNEELLGPLAKRPKGEPLEIAFSAYLGELFDKTFPPETICWQKPSSTPREVRLVADYGGWTVVKKVSMTAEKKEVVAACASMTVSTRGKLPELLLGEKVEEYENITGAFLAKYPERKSFARLAEILNAAGNELPRITAVSSGDRKLDGRLAKLFYYACFERAGFTPFVNADQVSRIWPELKIPKPRGNYGGKKKK